MLPILDVLEESPNFCLDRIRFSTFFRRHANDFDETTILSSVLADDMSQMGGNSNLQVRADQLRL